MNKSNDSGQKSSDRKSSPQGSNIIWYLFAIVVVLLLLVSVIKGDRKERIAYSVLSDLIAKTEEKKGDADQQPEVVVTAGDTTVQYSRLKKLTIWPYKVTGTVTRTVLTPKADQDQKAKGAAVPFRTDVQPENVKLAERLDAADIDFEFAPRTESMGQLRDASAALRIDPILLLCLYAPYGWGRFSHGIRSQPREAVCAGGHCGHVR